MTALKPTADEVAQGVAMVVHVLRGDFAKAVMVIDGNILWGMLQEDEVDPETSINPNLAYMMAHECAHVHDLKVMDEAFPNRILQHAYASQYEAIRGHVAGVCLEEYVACRLSAPAAHTMVEPGLRDIFQSACGRAKLNGNELIKAYRTHGDNDQILQEIVGLYGSVLKYAGYLLGQIHGSGGKIDTSPELMEFLEDSWFRSHMYRLENHLLAIYEKCGSWASIEELNELEEIVEDVLDDGGMEIYGDDQGRTRIVLPFTPETTPWMDDADEEKAGTAADGEIEN